MKRRGISLMELLVAITMTAIVTIAAVSAYSVAVDYQVRVLPERQTFQRSLEFERQVSNLMKRAFVDASGRTYFVIGVPGGGSTGSSSAEGDSITFTVRGDAIPGAAFSSTDDFETQHTNFGPIGGSMEVTLSTTAYGQATEQTGLFIRTQRPADGDPTQGGFESNFDNRIASMTFEAWDGLQWTSVFDSTIEQTPRLPAAVRVSYRLQNDDESTSRQFIVRLPLSDVTTDNPIETGGRP